MIDDGRLPACDRDRETAAQVLRDAYVAGRLRPEEFDQRVGVALAAETWRELDEVTADLPSVPRPGRDAARPSSDTVSTNGRTRALSWFFAVHAILVFLIVLMAGLAGRVAPAAAWPAYALVPLALLLPTWAGRRYLARQRKARSTGPPLPHAREWRH